MDNLRDVAEFRSPAFSPFLPDEFQANPEVYGAELAFWLCRELALRGVHTTYPRWEDWGWYIDYTAASGAKFAVHCSNVGGAPDHWMLHLRRFGRKLFGRDKPPFSDADPLVSQIQEILRTETSVSDLAWNYATDPAP